MNLSDLGRLLLGIGLLLVLFGLLLMALGRIPGIGRLPGDILYRRGGFTFYFPLTTSILLSLLLTLIFFIFHHR